MMASASRTTGRVAATTITTSTNLGSVKFRLSMYSTASWTLPFRAMIPANSAAAQSPKTTSVSARKCSRFSWMEPFGYVCAQRAKRFTEKVCSTASPKRQEARISTGVAVISGAEGCSG